MVYTGMPYSSWKIRSETEEERKKRHKIQSNLELYELEFDNELLIAKHGSRGPFYKKARRLILEKIQRVEAHNRFKKSWKNNRYWKKKGLSKESVLRLYAFTDNFYLRSDWDKYIYLKLFKK